MALWYSRPAEQSQVQPWKNSMGIAALICMFSLFMVPPRYADRLRWRIQFILNLNRGGNWKKHLQYGVQTYYYASNRVEQTLWVKFTNDISRSHTPDSVVHFWPAQYGATYLDSIGSLASYSICLPVSHLGISIRAVLSFMYTCSVTTDMAWYRESHECTRSLWMYISMHVGLIHSYFWLCANGSCVDWIHNHSSMSLGPERIPTESP